MKARTPGGAFRNRAPQPGRESPRDPRYLSDGLDAGFRGRGCECLSWESIFTTLACFQDAATSRAVCPVGPRISGFRSLRSNSDFTISTYPNCAAHQSGVPPHLESAMLGLISSRFNSNATTPVYHRCTAHKRGVRPYSVSAVLGLTSSRFNSNSTTPAYPRRTANMRGVRPYSVSAVLGLTSSRFNSNFTTPSYP